MRKLSTLVICLALVALFLIPADCKKHHTEKVDDSDTSPLKTATVLADVNAKKGPASAFIASFSTIIVSELGDKTFFIAAIMAMRYNRIAVLCGALFALFLMTAISTAFGQIVTALIDPFYVHIVTTLLFFFFGVKLLWDAYHDEGGESNEKSEVELELNQLHSKMMEKKTISNNAPSESENKTELATLKENAKEIQQSAPIDIESNGKASCANQIEKVATKLVFWQALTLTFLGEWGDRSQISTIALAANSSAFMVFLGGFLGHVCCTSLAVVGGKYLANKISEKMVNVSGGVLFLLFGIHNLLVGN
jgi:putative Ca2+/H+ antiporter (TMEM165/GDT1 family)